MTRFERLIFEKFKGEEDQSLLRFWLEIYFKDRLGVFRTVTPDLTYDFVIVGREMLGTKHMALARHLAAQEGHPYAKEKMCRYQIDWRGHIMLYYPAIMENPSVASSGVDFSFRGIPDEEYNLVAAWLLDQE